MNKSRKCLEFSKMADLLQDKKTLFWIYNTLRSDSSCELWDFPRFLLYFCMLDVLFESAASKDRRNFLAGGCEGGLSSLNKTWYIWQSPIICGGQSDIKTRLGWNKYDFRLRQQSQSDWLGVSPDTIWFLSKTFPSQQMQLARSGRWPASLSPPVSVPTDRSLSHLWSQDSRLMRGEEWWRMWGRWWDLSPCEWLSCWAVPQWRSRLRPWSRRTVRPRPCCPSCGWRAGREPSSRGERRSGRTGRRRRRRLGRPLWGRSATLTCSTCWPARSAPVWSLPPSLSAEEDTSTVQTVSQPPVQTASSASSPGKTLPMWLLRESLLSSLCRVNLGKITSPCWRL